MQALTYEGPWRVTIKQKADPRIEHPQDGIVRVETAAICGSDLHIMHGLIPDTRVGSTFGHEFVGTVEEVGPQVTGVRPGERVALPFQIFCGDLPTLRLQSRAGAAPACVLGRGPGLRASPRRAESP